MGALKTTAIRLAVLLVLQTPWLEASRAQAAGSPKLDEQVTIQEGIYRSRGEDVPEGYIVGRSLLSYTFALASEFDRSLADLGPQDRWLDIGAGEGRAILDYYTERYDSMHAAGRERRGKKARAVAISIEDRRTSRWHQTAASLEKDKIQYLFNRRLREYSLEDLGRFQLMTDVAGGFSYAFDLSLFVEKALGFLEINGRFFTLLQDVHLEAGSNQPYHPGSPFLTELVNADGSEMRVCSWLKSIGCVQVACEPKADWKPPLEVYRIHKVCNDVTVPALVPVQFEAGTPPERRYRLRDPLAGPARAAR